MRTTVTIPDQLVEDLMTLTQTKTRTQAVNRALEDWIKKIKVEKLRSLRGKHPIDDNWRELRALEAGEGQAPYGKRRR